MLPTHLLAARCCPVQTGQDGSNSLGRLAVAGRVLLILLSQRPAVLAAPRHSAKCQNLETARDTTLSLHRSGASDAQGRPRPRPGIRAAQQFSCDVVVQPVIYSMGLRQLPYGRIILFAIVPPARYGALDALELISPGRDRLDPANRPPAQINWRRALPRPLVPGCCQSVRLREHSARRPPRVSSHRS
jgi:hypothetical protein